MANIELDGSSKTIKVDTGDLTLDVPGEIHFDADGAIIRFKDNGTAIGTFENVSSDFIIKSSVSDKDLIFKGNDGGSAVTALTLDMSDAGAATFNSSITAGGLTINGGTNRQYINNGHLRLSDDYNLEWGGGTNFIRGSNANNRLIFQTNGSERMRIISDGNVGIGDTAPDTLLHITQGGEPPAEGMLILEANSASRQLRIQPPTDADNGFIDYKGGNLVFMDDGTEVARFQGSSGVGIGESSPLGKLHVKTADSGGTANANADELILEGAGSGSGVGMGILSATDGFGYIIFGDSGGNAQGGIQYHHNGDSMRIYTNDGERLRIDSSGNLGIGTSSPSASLHVLSNTEPQIIIEATDTGGGVGPELKLFRNSSSPADADDIGIIDFVGENSAGEEFKYAQIKSIITDASDGSEDGTLELFHGRSGQLTPSFRITPTEVVVNDSSNDLDFRVESNGVDNMLFVNANDNTVSIGGEATPLGRLHVFTADSGASAHANADELVVEGSAHSGITIASGNSSTGTIAFADDGDTLLGRIVYDHANNDLSFGSGGVADRMIIDSSGRVGIATTSPGSFNSQAQNLAIGSGSGDAGMTIFSGSGSGDSGNIFFADGTSGSDPVRGGITYKHDDNSLIFRVDDSPTVTLDSSHNMIFDNSGSGVYLGVTSATASNLLDDYEEGTHTVTLTDSIGNASSITLNSSYNQISYRKVGSLVHVQGVIVVTGMSGNFNDSGSRVRFSLPFTAADLQDQSGKGHVGVGVYNVNFTAGTAPYFITIEGQAYMEMQVSGDSSGGGNGQLSTSSQIYVGGTFIAS